MLNRSLALNPKAESFICCNMKASLDTKKQRSIALYGGSFDPVHGAHLEVAWTALENCDLDTVIFIPTAQSPLKKNAAMAADTDRVEMLRLATAEESRFEVDTCELERGGTSYTVDTVKAYQTAHEGCRYIGSLVPISLSFCPSGAALKRSPRWSPLSYFAVLVTRLLSPRSKGFVSS